MKVIEYELEKEGQQMVFAAKTSVVTEQHDRARISGYLDWLRRAHPEAYDALAFAAECTVRLEDLV